jgi:hypothetical protein
LLQTRIITLSEILNDRNKHSILLPNTLIDRNRDFVQSLSIKYQSYWKDFSTVLAVGLDFIIINFVLKLFIIINDEWKRECCTGRICHTFVGTVLYIHDLIILVLAAMLITTKSC